MASVTRRIARKGMVLVGTKAYRREVHRGLRALFRKAAEWLARAYVPNWHERNGQ